MQFFPLLTALLLAHLMGDFVFQSERVVRGKAAGRWSAYLEHAAVHFGLMIVTLLLFTGSLGISSTWILILVILLSHLLFDWLKTLLKSRTRQQLLLFVLDQMLHVMVIFIGAAVISGTSSLQILSQLLPVPINIGIVIAGYVAAMFGMGWFNSLLLKPLADRYAEETNRDSLAGMQGLNRAGMLIGWLERMLILTAVLLQSPVGVGFVLAAKSVFRFENTRAGQQAAEYFIIGTLVSVTEGVLIGLGLLWLLQGAGQL